MNADTATDLQMNLPLLIKPGTWNGFGVANTAEDVVGKISVIRLDPKLEEVTGRLVFADSKVDGRVTDGESGGDERLDVLVTPQAALVVTHTKATHREIEKFIGELRFGEHGSSNTGFSGGGFFNLSAQSSEQ